MNTNMYEFDINKAKPNEAITGVFLIKSYKKDITKSKKDYLIVELSNKYGNVSCKLWDVTDEIIETYFNNKKAIAIQATVNEYMGSKQLIINKQKVVDMKELDMSLLVPSSNFDADMMYSYIFNKANNFEDRELNYLTTHILDDVKDKLMYYGCSKQHHHNYRAGLLEHKFTMLKNAEFLVSSYGNNINKELLFAAIMLHDLGKIKELQANEYGVVGEYTFEGEMLGHIQIMLQDLAVYIFQINSDMEYNDGVTISNRTQTLLSHLILSHHGQPEYGSPRHPMTKEAELLHSLDMLDTKMFMFDDVLGTLDSNNNISNRQWALDNRKIVKHLD